MIEANLQDPNDLDTEAERMARAYVSDFDNYKEAYEYFYKIEHDSYLNSFCDKE